MPDGAEAADLPGWWKKEAARKEKRGEKHDPREADIIAQWPEKWTAYHIHGLECIAMSGRISSTLFTIDPGHRVEPILEAFPSRDPSTPWIYFVAGQLLAGVGAEILLKGVYMKAGYSLRNPDNPRKEPLARLGPDARRFNPRVSASFATLLQDHNLQLLGDEPLAYKPLTVAKWWRNDAAHTAMTSGGEAGVYSIKLGLILRHLHRTLLKDAEPKHLDEVGRILRDQRPIAPPPP